MSNPAYEASYAVKKLDEATKVVHEMMDGVIASCGNGNEQWSGLDFTDKGATITLSWRSATGDGKTNWIIIKARVPFMGEVPGWFSPVFVEDVDTWNPNTGEAMNGEAYAWGESE